MQFIVTSRLIDQPVAPPAQELAMIKASFQGFTEHSEPRFKAIYPHADERATTFLVEVDSAEELTEVIGFLPASRLCTFESHPVTTPQSVLSLLTVWEKGLQS